MDDEIKQEAKRFVDSLPDRLQTAAEAPPIWEVQKARLAEFPFFAAGVDARSSALRQRFGDEYAIRIVWGGTAVNRETRLAGLADGRVSVTMPGKGTGEVRFQMSPGSLKVSDHSFGPADERAFWSVLDRALKELLESDPWA